MKTKLTIIALSFIALFSCTNPQPKATGETVTITHTLGTVQIPKNPQRVVVLDFSALENLDYLGIQPVGMPKSGVPSHLSKYANDKSIADVGTVVEVNLEKINELEPDLIIMGGRLQDFYNDLSSIAPVLYPVVINTTDFMGAFETVLNDMALIFDKQEEVDTALDNIKTRVANIQAHTAASDHRALILLHNRGRFSAYGSGSRFGIIHDLFGVKEAEPGMGVHLHGNPVSSEFIQKVNPDIIYIVDRSQVVGNDVIDKDEIENKLVQQTQAAIHNRIIYLNPEVWYLAGGGVASVNMMMDEIEGAM